ncbi:unnamed protein product, partial [Prorocentrum cordatum]
MVRGSLEEMAPSLSLRHDMAPRLYLLEDPGAWGAPAVVLAPRGRCPLHAVRAAAPRKVRRALSFAPVPWGEVRLEPCGGAPRGAGWALWSPEVRHAAQAGGAKKLGGAASGARRELPGVRADAGRRGARLGDLLLRRRWHAKRARGGESSSGAGALRGPLAEQQREAS